MYFSRLKFSWRNDRELEESKMVWALEFYQFYLNHWSGSIDYKKPIDCSYNQGYGNNCEYCWTQWIKNSIGNPSCNSFVLIQVSKIPTKEIEKWKNLLVKVGSFIAEFWFFISFSSSNNTLQRLKLGKLKFMVCKIGCSLSWTR